MVRSLANRTFNVGEDGSDAEPEGPDAGSDQEEEKPGEKRRFAEFIATVAPDAHPELQIPKETQVKRGGCSVRIQTKIKITF